LDLATASSVGSLATAWRSDLPLIAGEGSVLALRGDNVELVSLTSAPPREVLTLHGGGKDLWLAIPWVPNLRAPEAIAAAEKALVTQDSALAPSDSAPVDSTNRATIWLQVSSSQNPDWAKDLANQLRTAGQPAEVWDPVPPEESYR